MTPSINSSLKASSKFTLLASLYLAQGLPFGFFQQALPVLLRKGGVSLEDIGYAHFLTLPWALKFLWAPAVDRWQIPKLGLRRSWLIPLQLLSVLTFAALSQVTPREDLFLVLIAFLLTNLITASQDIATDGLAVDLMTRKERGWANGIQVSAYRVGMVIGGGALLWVFDRWNWATMMLSMAGISLLCTIPVLRMKETVFSEQVRPPTRGWSETLKEIIHFCLQPGAPAWILVLLLYKSAHYLATGMLRPWLVDAGYSATDIAIMVGTYGFGAGLVGAMLGGFCASRFDRPRLLLLFGFLETFAIASYVWPVSSAAGTVATYKVAVAISLDHFTSGLATAVLFTMMMDACSKARAASDYTIQACLVVAATGVAGAVSGKLAQTVGYIHHFEISGAMAILALAATAFVLRRPKVRALLTVNAA